MIIQPRWRKVIKDLWGNKVRTALVVLSIAVGVFAIGMILGADVMLRQDLTQSYLSTNPAGAVLYLSPFDEALVETVANMDGIADAEGRRNVSLRALVGPDQWKTLDVDVIADYDDIRLSKIAPAGGEWPPESNSLLMERASLGLVNAAVGEKLVVERPDGKLREMPIVGLAHDVNRPPAQFTGEPAAFITMSTLEWLGFERTFSELHILTEDDALTKEEIEEVAGRVQDKVEKAGYVVYGTRVPEPGEHPVQEIVDPLLLILGVLGALSLFASSFLVINIINGLMSQQTQQIGVMKAVGARRGQIAQMYLVAILLLGMLALFIAIPLGGIAAYLFTRYIAGLLNFDLAGFRIPLQAVVVMTAVGLFVPLLAALAPVINGSRITVREALNSYGLGKGRFGSNLVDRSLSWITGTALRLSRPMQISLRNTVRRKARLLLTLITLTLGGAIFIGITSVHASLLRTLDEALNYFAYDVEVNFDRDYRMEELWQQARQVEGVVEVDSWLGVSAARQRPDGKEGDSFPVLGTVAETAFIKPKMLEGRWLLPDDDNAVILNTDVLENEPDVRVGDTVTLEIAGREGEWQVVGLVQGVLTGPIAYVNRPALERELRQVGRASGIQVIAADHDRAAQRELALRLREHFESQGYQVSTTGTIGEIRDRVEYQFNLVVVFLTIMAILIAAVGGLGLMGTMSINVLERTREIGVMRAVGASDGSVLRIVLVEGLFVGIISWALATVFGYPIGLILSNLVGNSLLDNPLSYTFAFNGAAGWLIAVVAIAALAGLFPAWRASRLSVQQTLAYE